MVKIKAKTIKVPCHFRAGFRFNRELTSYELSDAQYKKVKNDPHLFIKQDKSEPDSNKTNKNNKRG